MRIGKKKFFFVTCNFLMEPAWELVCTTLSSHPGKPKMKHRSKMNNAGLNFQNVCNYLSWNILAFLTRHFLTFLAWNLFSKILTHGVDLLATFFLGNISARFSWNIGALFPGNRDGNCFANLLQTIFAFVARNFDRNSFGDVLLNISTLLLRYLSALLFGDRSWNLLLNNRTFGNRYWLANLFWDLLCHVITVRVGYVLANFPGSYFWHIFGHLVADLPCGGEAFLGGKRIAFGSLDLSARRSLGGSV